MIVQSFKFEGMNFHNYYASNLQVKYTDVFVI